MTAAPVCPSCDRPRLRRTNVSREVSAASIAVHGERLAINHCGCGYVEVPTQLGRAARSAVEDALPVARGRTFRSDVCCSCGAELTMPARRTTRAVTVTPDEETVTTLRFDLPMRRCPGCGLDQLPHRARHDVVVALSALFQAATDHISGDDAIDPSELGPLARLNYTLRRHRRT